MRINTPGSLRSPRAIENRNLYEVQSILTFEEMENLLVMFQLFTIRSLRCSF